MKISAAKYAEALYASLAEKKNAEAKELIKRFVAVVAANNDARLFPSIIDSFISLWDSQAGELSAVMASARHLNESSRQAIISYLQKKTGAKEVSLEEKIDDSLLGGFVLCYGDRVIDGSLKNSLECLQDKLSN